MAKETAGPLRFEMLVWAAREARLRQAELRAVYAGRARSSAARPMQHIGVCPAGPRPGRSRRHCCPRRYARCSARHRRPGCGRSWPTAARNRCCPAGPRAVRCLCSAVPAGPAAFPPRLAGSPRLPARRAVPVAIVGCPMPAPPGGQGRCQPSGEGNPDPDRLHGGADRPAGDPWVGASDLLAESLEDESRARSTSSCLARPLVARAADRPRARPQTGEGRH